MDRMKCGLLLPMLLWRGASVCLSVNSSVTLLKMAERIEILFELETLFDQRHNTVHNGWGSRTPYGEGEKNEEKMCPL